MMHHLAKAAWRLSLAACIFSTPWQPAVAQSAAVITISADKPVAKVSPNMWGVFFEDINLGADGGIYAEMVKNRSFEFTKPLMGWTIKRTRFEEGDVQILHRQDKQITNPRFIRIKAKNAAKGDLGLINEGFRGMGIKQGLRYDFSVMYKRTNGALRLHIGLMDSTGKDLGNTIVPLPQSGDAWQKATASFTANATELKGKFYLWLEGTGETDLDMISLFPSDTWKNRPGGLRSDMVQMLADMKPGFIRFPGGCIVEGFDLSNRYQWKKTIGPVEDRSLMINRWNFEFAHRAAPDYFQTFGLGFYEYFQLAEDLGAAPLPILNCGMACQYNSAEMVPLDELDPYIQDALDLIEFANGDPSTPWGKVRSTMGHPAPFNLTMLGIGNENWGPQYIERLRIFTAAVKAKYPEIKLVNSSGTDPKSERFDYLNKALRDMNVDIIDEHYYRSPDWFLSNASRYDDYPRQGPKVFGGEYAAHSDRVPGGPTKNSYFSALSEAAFMTGLERNADVVIMASYAPLFAHADGWQWSPDLIWVNNLESYGTPNYHVQKMFSTNKGTTVVPLTLDGKPLAGQDSIYASAVLDEPAGELVIKLVNASGKAYSRSVQIQGTKLAGKSCRITTLQSQSLDQANTFQHPTLFHPAESTLAFKGNQLPLTAAPYSFQVIRVKLAGR